MTNVQRKSTTAQHWNEETLENWGKKTWTCVGGERILFSFFSKRPQKTKAACLSAFVLLEMNFRYVVSLFQRGVAKMENICFELSRQKSVESWRRSLFCFSWRLCVVKTMSPSVWRNHHLYPLRGLFVIRTWFTATKPETDLGDGNSRGIGTNPNSLVQDSSLGAGNNTIKSQPSLVTVRAIMNYASTIKLQRAVSVWTVDHPREENSKPDTVNWTCPH